MRVYTYIHMYTCIYTYMHRHTHLYNIYQCVRKMHTNTFTIRYIQMLKKSIHSKYIITSHYSISNFEKNIQNITIYVHWQILTSFHLRA